MVHSEVYLNKYVVSVAPFSIPACSHCSQNMTYHRNLLFFCIFSHFNCSSICPGGQLIPFALCVRTPKGNLTPRTRDSSALFEWVRSVFLKGELNGIVTQNSTSTEVSRVRAALGPMCPQALLRGCQLIGNESVPKIITNNTTYLFSDCNQRFGNFKP